MQKRVEEEEEAGLGGAGGTTQAWLLVLLATLLSRGSHKTHMTHALAGSSHVMDSRRAVCILAYRGCKNGLKKSSTHHYLLTLTHSLGTMT
jgi:hypothetical protein